MPAARRVARRSARRTEARVARRADTTSAPPASPQEPTEPAAPPEQTAPPPVETTTDDVSPDVAQRLSDLNELHDTGRLTDEQFEEAKKRIVD